MERRDVRAVNGKRGEGSSVGNGLDRGCVDVVADADQMPTPDVLAFQVLLIATPRWSTTTVSNNTVAA